MTGTKNNYTCNDYRAEMILLGLTARLNQENLSEKEKKELLKEIKELESAMGME